MPVPPILITGARGFVGRHLIAHLLSCGSEARSLVACVSPRQAHEAAWPTGQAHEAAWPQAGQAHEAAWPQAGLAGWGPQLGSERVQIVGLDVGDAAATSALFERVRPASVYHLAARASGADADRAAVMAVNVEGTRHVLEAAARLTPFPRVLLASTSYVYGETDPARPAREEDALGPLGRYGPYVDSKMQMERLAGGYGGLTIVARAFAHTGAGQAAAFALPAFARQLARIESGASAAELYVGNLSAQRDMLDVRDVVSAYVMLMGSGRVGEVYNVAVGRALSMREILDRLLGLCRVGVEVKIDANRLRPADIGCSTGDAFKLRSETGWQPQYRLEQTLEQTLQFWRNEA